MARGPSHRIRNDASHLHPGAEHTGLRRRHRRHVLLRRSKAAISTGQQDRFADTLHAPPAPPGTVPPATNIADANPGTFYSAISNVDFEIGDNNPGAVAIRFHGAQHAFLAHIDFHIGSGFAAIHEVANEAEDLHFYGGRYGIMARKPSPAWQFTCWTRSSKGSAKPRYAKTRPA